MKRVSLRHASAVLLGVLALALFGCDNGGKPNVKAPVVRPVLTVVVEPAPAGVRRTYPASVLPAQVVELSFRVSGRITELPVRAATKVKKGGVIAQLDKRDFLNAIEQLKGQIAEAEAQLALLSSGARAEEIARLEAALEAAAARLGEAQNELARTQQLHEEGFSTDAALQQAETAARVAEADLRTAREQLAEARAGAREEEIDAQEAVIRGLRTQLEAAQSDLEDATLRAPFDGIIASRDVDNFANVTAGQEIAVLQRLDTIDLVFDLPGPDVVTFSNSENVTTLAMFDAIPHQEFEARLVEFSTEADPTTQTFRTRVAIDRPLDATILPGMVGTIAVRAASSADVEFSIPMTALAGNAEGETFVWLVNAPDNTLAMQPVVTGEASGQSVVVESGLKAGDVVVIAGLSRLQPDMVVRPISEIGQ